MSQSAMSDEQRIADRYGKASRGPELIIIGAAIALVILAGLVIQLLKFSEPSVGVITTGHSVIDDGSVRITFTLQGEPDMTVSCTANAVNKQFAEVGAKQVEITMAEEREAHELVLNTSERAAAASIETCSVLTSR